MRASVIAKVLFFFLYLFTATASAEPFSINSAVVSKVGNGHKLNATMHYQLTPRVKQALENGVPIIFFQQFELNEPMLLVGEYFDWYTARWSETIRYELRYHALTEQYVLTHLDTRYHHNFTSLSSALTALGNIKNFTLPPEHLIDTEDVKLELKTGLDLHALPTPMRPGAMISSKWQLDSPWFTAQWQ